ncbi:MAG: 50S ribosomal protein L21 [Actinomycetota bacterium]
MYAVIKSGGKQHKVKTGDVLEVELLGTDDGDSITFTPLLVVDDDGKSHVGKDIAKATVEAKLLGEHKGEKVKVFRYRPKTGYSKRQGHRQTMTLIEIGEIGLGSSRAPRKKADDAETEPAADAAE